MIPPFNSPLTPSLPPYLQTAPLISEDFGFKHLLWVYSGRRGVHCWVCDKEAMQLSQEARQVKALSGEFMYLMTLYQMIVARNRTAIVDYLSLVKGGEQQAQKVKLPSILHPSIR